MRIASKEKILRDAELNSTPAAGDGEYETETIARTSQNELEARPFWNGETPWPERGLRFAKKRGPQAIRSVAKN